MTRTYSRQVCKDDPLTYLIVCRVYEKNELLCMFNACFDKDFGLVSLNVVNVSLLNSSMSIEIQNFFNRAYKLCSGLEDGILEFSLSDTF